MDWHPPLALSACRRLVGTGVLRSPRGNRAAGSASSGRTGHLEVVPGISKCALLSALKPSTASANASVVVPHVTLATAALVVARVADNICRCGVQLERGIPPALPAAAMLLTSSLPLPPLLPPSSPALPHGLLLLRSCLHRCMQLMALPQWLMRMAMTAVQQRAVAVARRASCLRGLAGGLFAAGSIHLESIVEENSSSEVRLRELEPIRCTCAAAECLCERADGQPVHADLPRLLLTPEGAAGALDKGDFRVRGFGGVFVFPVMARVRT